MPTTTVDVQEAKERLTELLALAEAGTDVILTEDNRPVARLVSIAPGRRRVAGLHAGSDLDDRRLRRAASGRILDRRGVKLLLDTQSFIWWDSDPGKLSVTALAACQDDGNALLLSLASAWEMQIKLMLEKLTLRLPLLEIIQGQERNNSLELLPIALDHILALQTLPAVHRDPFDRLLIAQALVEDAVLLSSDAVFLEYDVRRLW